MNELTVFTSAQTTMTSREIAELTGKQHKHVLRDIDNLLISLSPDLGYGFKSTTYVSGDPPREYRQFEMDRDSVYCLVAGYDPTARMKIIKRWQELEEKGNHRTVSQANPSQEEYAARAFKAWLEIGQLADAPRSFALQIAAEETYSKTGVNVGRMITGSVKMDAIPIEDVMLEPSDLGERLGLGLRQGAGRRLNVRLEEIGWQTKTSGTWEPTELGRPHCERHGWSKNVKSGYNLKWNAKAVAEILGLELK